MENIFWIARTSKPRHEAINQIKNVVGRYGNIMDFNLFSDVSLSMTIELEEP